jgi:Ferritin-like domain
VVISAPGAGGTRRKLLRSAGGSLAAGAAAIVAGCSRKSRRPKVHEIPPQARAVDVSVLNNLLDREHRAIAAYTATIPLLSGSAHEAAKLFLSHELSHAGELAGLIKQAGGKANKPASSYDLGRPGDRTELLSLLHTMEHDQVAGYLDALVRISPGEARAAVAAILANDAQHVTVLRAELGIDPLPAAFVAGGE